MGQPAAKKGDRVVATDTHIVMVSTPSGPVPTPLPHPFSGSIAGGLSGDVNIAGMPAATAGSTADAVAAHTPTPPGTAFQNPPANRATIQVGSAAVHINGKGAARHGDVATTCNDPTDLPVGTVVATGSVLVG
jgi:uncharacterized Zn-binding protein involved in type VI secretion